MTKERGKEQTPRIKSTDNMSRNRKQPTSSESCLEMKQNTKSDGGNKKEKRRREKEKKSKEKRDWAVCKPNGW